MILESYKSVINYILNERQFVGTKGSCRYCGKTSKEVKFKKIAHSIPELLGNKYLFSNDECDECNSYFDQFLENNLANFLGVSRTTSQIVGKKGVPKQKSNQGDRIEAINGDLVIIQREESNTYEQISDNLVKIESTAASYIPVNVYKCLVKIALSVLPDAYLRTFSETIRWVRHDAKPHGLDSRLLNLHVTMFPGKNPFSSIWLQLYKRQTAPKKHPYMICVLAFSNYMFQFAIPFNKKDRRLDLSQIEIPLFPFPPFFKLPGQAPGVEPRSYSVNLSGKESVQPQNYAHMYAGDMKTVNVEDIPQEILERIKELGLEFDGEKI
ncbi:HNH endonuclease [Photobacterium leiognathi]|uniref:HNH endonuclease n=3 Tax=Vibrionaceae TaxID=641 RepID=UPI0029825F1E|nr:HNH endonuclease [Photobacterium leiognathi]